MEEELLAVQQGDLRNEQALKSRAVVRSQEGYLILEALAKGNLASFRWHEAQHYSDSILRRQPDDARALWLRALARVEMQQEELALEDLKQAIQSEPTAKVTRRSLAGLLYELGYVQDAMEQCEMLLAVDPNDELANRTLVSCLQDEARLSEATKLIDSFKRIS